MKLATKTSDDLKVMKKSDGIPPIDSTRLVKIRDGMSFPKSRCNPSPRALSRARRLSPFLIRWTAKGLPAFHFRPSF